MEERKLRVNIILSLHGAMIGNLSQHVRVICCDWENTNWVKLKFYLDVIPNEIEKELISVILTEFESNIQAFGFQFVKYQEEIVFSTEPYEKLDKLKLVLYWRNETSVF